MSVKKSLQDIYIAQRRCPEHRNYKTTAKPSRPKEVINYPLRQAYFDTSAMKKSFGAKTIKTLIFEDIESSKIQGKKAAQNLNVFFAKMVEK